MRAGPKSFPVTTICFHTRLYRDRKGDLLLAGGGLHQAVRNQIAHALGESGLKLIGTDGNKRNLDMLAPGQLLIHELLEALQRLVIDALWLSVNVEEARSAV